MTTEYHINYIRKEYPNGNDIATALENLEDYDHNPEKPTLSTSSASNAAEKK